MASSLIVWKKRPGNGGGENGSVGKVLVIIA